MLKALKESAESSRLKIQAVQTIISSAFESESSAADRSESAQNRFFDHDYARPSVKLQNIVSGSERGRDPDPVTSVRISDIDNIEQQNSGHLPEIQDRSIGKKTTMDNYYAVHLSPEQSPVEDIADSDFSPDIQHTQFNNW